MKWLGKYNEKSKRLWIVSCYILLYRAIDVNSLIGNIGGYIGLCLGYSLLQVPLFIKKIVTKSLSQKSAVEQDPEAAYFQQLDATITKSWSNQELRIETNLSRSR